MIIPIAIAGGVIVLVVLGRKAREKLVISK